jgi:hypothetical protein
MRTNHVGCFVAAAFVACGPSPRPPGGNTPDAPDAPPGCQNQCSSDDRTVLDCHGNPVAMCAATEACDVATATCVSACVAAESAHSSVGCDYYATSMDSYGLGNPQVTLCYAAFVANTWTTPAHLAVEYRGSQLAVEGFASVPSGSGPTLTYGPYDATAGLAPGQVAILFLGGTAGGPPLGCPLQPAVAAPQITGTGIADSFHITTDVPAVAYQINPYGGGSVEVTGASLLIPTSAWDTNYVAVNVSQAEFPTPTVALNPSLNLVARDDNTTVTITPNVPIVGGNGVGTAAAGQPLAIHLNKGQHVQITQSDELTGSVVTSTNPVGLMAGQYCMRMPANTLYCDHGEQMIPPVRALGNRYIGVMYRPRVPNETQTYWRVVGAVDGTQLTWSTPVGGPATLSKGQSVTFLTGAPFVVSSQDKDHPFMLFTYMTSSAYVQDGFGDPDFVLDVPPEQFLHDYVFFTDPTYPETDLVLLRGPDASGQYHDVSLDCLGAVQGWQSIDGSFQFARVDVQTGNFAAVGNCSNGRHEIQSEAPFGLQVWGWGTPLTTTFTQDVSYGYPGGMSVLPINDVVIE